jgi:2'-5' RNA ligase
MRVFLALVPDEKTRTQLASISRKLRSHALGGNFTSTSNFHVTLVFIGDVSEETIAKLAALVEKTQFFPFVIKTKQLGFFATKGIKDILVWNIERQPDLSELQRQLMSELRQMGFVLEEREYRPHFTLARKVHFPETFAMDLEHYPAATLYMKCDRMSLMESIRTNGKLTYREIMGHTMESPSTRLMKKK